MGIVRELLRPVRGHSWQVRRDIREARHRIVSLIHDAILKDIAPESKRRTQVRDTRKRRRQRKRRLYDQQDAELSRKRLWGGGNKDSEEVDNLLYLCYIGTIQGITEEATADTTEYTTLRREDFQRLTRRRQLQEFRKIGLTGCSLETILANTQPNREGDGELTPDLDTPQFDKDMSISELLQLRGTVEHKVKMLRQYQGKMRRNARILLRHKLRHSKRPQGEVENVIGETAISEACRIHQSIEKHRELFREVAKLMKKMVKKKRSIAKQCTYHGRETRRINH